MRLSRNLDASTTSWRMACILYGQQRFTESTMANQSKRGEAISNRFSAAKEAKERREHPPVNTGSPPAEDAAGRVGDEPIRNTDGLQTAHKAGSRAIAQKQS